ncbi:MAG: hydantoinase B/oxoprolinase family protein [Chloroflexi bacterium]|nr:hydantoinase B/oxoprolinase family protein [Chloroflexota bacterium]
MEYDPITLKVLWDRLVAITEDAAATMVKTTFSPIVRQGNDYCCSLIDLNGRQLAEPPFTLPSFTGTLPFTVRHFLKKYPIAELEPGDSIVTNDSWMGTGHLNDFNIATPIFDRTGRCIAISSSVAHMTDIGGAINFGGNRDVHEEGLRIPITKVVRKGVLNADLVELMQWNVRTPDQLMGDLTGMLAANATMAERVLELVGEAKIPDFMILSDEIQRRSEDSMRAAIAELPDGRYQGSVTFDGAGAPVTIVATVEIDGTEARVDFTGTSPQDNSVSINVVMNYTYAFTVYPLKLLIHPRLPSNDGCLRPLKISAPPGSLLNAQYPAAGFSRNYMGHMIHAALFSAFEHIAPERIWAHSGSAPAGLECLTGLRSDGRPFVHLFFVNGGTGACPTKDGEICTFPTNASATSVEATEHLAPVVFDFKELVPDSAGPGKYRGGLASRWRIRNAGEAPLLYSGQVGRINYPALGLLGGQNGQPNQLFVDGEPVTRGWGRYELKPGGTFEKVNSGGGGLHPPFLRDPQAVLEDILEGYVTPERARADYGVVVEGDQITGFTEGRRQVTS